MARLVNVHNFHSNAKNRDYSIIQIERPLTAREKNNGYVGDTIFEEVFLPDLLIGVVGRADINTEINLLYEVVGGKANLVNIEKGGK